MNIETFLLCDAATDSMGKLNILGAFDTIGSPNFPLIHPQCSVAVSINLKFTPLTMMGNFYCPQLMGNLMCKFLIRIVQEQSTSFSIYKI